VLRGLGLILSAALAAGFAGLGVVLAPTTVVLAFCLALAAGPLGFVVTTNRTRPSATESPTAEPAAGSVSDPSVSDPSVSDPSVSDPSGSGPSVWRAGRQRRAVAVGSAAAVAVAVATLTVAGMVAVLGAATGPLLLLIAAVLAPWGWSRLRPHADRYWTGRVAVGSGCLVEPNVSTGPRPLVSVLASLSTAALCREWQRSYLALRAAPDQATRDAIIELRTLPRRTAPPRPRGPDPLARRRLPARGQQPAPPPHRAGDHPRHTAAAQRGRTLRPTTTRPARANRAASGQSRGTRGTPTTDSAIGPPPTSAHPALRVARCPTAR